MVLTSTPPLQALKMPEQSLVQEIYDSDMQMGPFFEEGVEDELFVSMDESVVPADAIENVEDSSSVTALINAEIDSFKVIEIRKDLNKRGMFKNGLKSVLVTRLKEAVKKNQLT